MTFREFAAKQKRPARLTSILEGMPNVKSWAELRKFLTKQQAVEEDFIAARALWRKFQNSEA